MTEKSQGGKALVRPTTLAGRMRRRLTTAPRPSSPTRLQLFLPRSIPRTAICIWFLPSFKSPATITRLAEGAGHPINFLALVEETAAKEASGKPIEAFGAARPEDEFGLYFRRHLPGRRKRRRARTTLLQQRGYGPAS